MVVEILEEAPQSLCAACCRPVPFAGDIDERIFCSDACKLRFELPAHPHW